ncbi:hypothetical protein LJR231_003500 [Phyllobacterium sp. LjRoot231]|uniref:hypothetical protein n=1 Tax=Phyllobacterium sp. LjRoot231 TaxID=3342289 RepID=UPI003ECD69D3
MNSQAQAWFSLSQTQRRLAHEYHRFALEDEKNGNLERYKLNRDRSDRLWRSAKWSFQRLKVWRFVDETAEQEHRRAA